MPREPEKKVLSFSTTMRNPERIAYFLTALLDFEGSILTHDVIMNIVKKVLQLRLYRPIYVKNHTEFSTKFDNLEQIFSDEELEQIIHNSPQSHKERGFDKGWESRFDTWYKLMSEFGFCYYAKDRILIISQAGRMLISSCYDIENHQFKENIDGELISSVFLNALAKYEVGNPYKKNLNHNAPFRLLLKLLLKFVENNMTCLSVKEIPILLCWGNNDIQSLFDYIVALRVETFEATQRNFSYSNEFIYEKCLELLDSQNRDRFKMSQIMGEAVDEYIRKMRITGLISIRGAGRFIDINHNQMQKIEHILLTATNFTGVYLDDSDENRFAFYEYMSQIDTTLITPSYSATEESVKITKLREFANTYSKEQVENELRIVCFKKTSRDSLLKIIDNPLRLEFLTAIYLCQSFDNLDVVPNYKCDDEGVPTFTASGGMADIVASDRNTESYVEVTLIQNRAQTTNEMIPIERHLYENIQNSQNTKDKFSIFIAPTIHQDAIRYAQFAKNSKNLNIPYYSIEDFIHKARSSIVVSDFNDEILLV